MHRLVRGSLHQGDATFGANAGRQCTAVAAVACCSLLLRGPESWSRADVDNCVRAGNRLYSISIARRAPLHQGILEENATNANYIGVGELHLVAGLPSGDVEFRVDDSNIVYGSINGFDGHMTLEAGLAMAFGLHRAVIVVTCDYAIAFFRADDNEVYVFDSHSRNARGMPCGDGTAVLLRLGSVEQAANHVRLLYNVASREPHKNDFHVAGVELAEDAASHSSTTRHDTVGSSGGVFVGLDRDPGANRRRLFSDVLVSGCSRPVKPERTPTTPPPQREEWPLLRGAGVVSPQSVQGDWWRRSSVKPSPTISDVSSGTSRHVQPGGQQVSRPHLLNASPVSSTASPAAKKARPTDQDSSLHVPNSTGRRLTAKDKKRLQKEKDRERKQQARADAGFRQREAAADAERRRVARQNEDTRRLEADADAERRRVARQDEDTRRLEVDADAERRRVARQNEDSRRLEADADAERRRVARQDEDSRRLEANADAARRRVARQDQTTRRLEADANAERRRVARQNEDTRRLEADADAERRRVARQNEDTRRLEADANTERRRVARQDQTTRRLEADADAERRRVARQNEDTRRLEADANTERRRVARQDQTTRRLEADADAERRRVARQNEDTRRLEADANTERRRVARQNEDTRRLEADADAERRRVARQDEEVRRREADANAELRRAARQNDETREREAAACAERRRLQREYEQMKTRFFATIKEGPTWICCCCGQLWFRKSVKLFSEAQLSAKPMYAQWRNVCKCRDPSVDTFILCSTCQRHLIQKKKVPPLALANGLEFPPIPNELQGLNQLEERLISARIPFMQIRRLGGGGDQQFGLRGNCINVPVDVNTSVAALPRLPRNSQVVHVQLMRRMQDARPYAFEAVRPRVVMRAARYLVDSPLYRKHNIALDENWLENFAQDIAREQQEAAQLETDSAEVDDTSPDDDWNQETEQERFIMEQQETLLDDVILPDTGIRIAPGEGRVPVSLLFDEDVEELSFPATYAGQLRLLGVSLSQRVKAEARMYDRRCANPHKMFFSFCRLRRDKLAKHINTVVRKKRGGQSLSVRDVVCQAAVDQLVQHNEGYHVLQVDRSSPAYLEAKKKIILAMVRQEGVPIFFITFSCAEHRWVELIVILKKTVDGETLTEDEAQELPWREKARLVQSDPYTVSRYCNEKFKAMWKLASIKGGPLQDFPIVDSFVRVEFQNRGTQHYHCLVWVKNAPLFDVNAPETWPQCEAFIDLLVTCFQNPDKADLLSVQMHRHMRTCKREVRGEVICRFGFPVPPMRGTKILPPLAEETRPEEKRRLKNLYNSIQEKMSHLYKDLPHLTFDEYLQSLECSEEEYYLAIRSQLRRPKVYLRRNLCEIFLNAYNEELLELQNANMDIQFILDAYSCITYIVDYVGKSERGLSLLIKEAADRVRQGNVGLVQQLREISNVFINKSEVSAQEVAFHNLSMPLTSCSIGNIFIPTSPPEERTRMLKSAHNLELLMEQDPDSPDIFVQGLVDHYVQRPDVMEDVCLADFAAWYEFKGKRPRQQRQQQEPDDVDEDDVDRDEEEVPAHTVPLKDGSGFIRRRTKAKIIRYRNYSVARDPENYMREQVMLYSSWRSEEAFTANPQQFYSDEALNTIIKLNRTKYVKVSIDLDELLQDVLRDQVRDEEDPGDAEAIDRPDLNVYELGEADIGQDLGPDVINVRVDSERFLLPNFQPEDEYLADIASLNQRQRHFHDNYVHMIKTKPNEQMLSFVSGGAGVGKTKLIKVVTQSTLRVHVQKGGHPDHLVVALMAPTGRAAFNMGGVTVHSGLHIFNQNEENSLQADTLNTLRAELCHVQLFVLDEISMIGRRMLAKINARLQQIFGNRLVMGGKSVLCLGDLNQLPPVGDSWVFLAQRGDLNVLSGPQVWRQFRHFELTQIMRQREDARLAEALSRLADGCTTVEDDALFTSREVRPDGLQVPESAPHLYASNQGVNDHNAIYLNSVVGETCECEAFDYCEGLGSELARRRALFNVRNASLQNTQNLPLEVVGKVGAPYMITVNVNTKDGIVNGTSGTLRRIVWGRMANNERTPLRLYLECGEAVGRIARADNVAAMQRDGVVEPWTPIGRVTKCIIPSRGATFKVMRRQFPLVPCKAMTVHKSQGSTLPEAAAHLPLPARSMYVAFTRVPTLAALFIVGTYRRPNPPAADNVVKVEQRRLKEPANTLQFCIQFPDLHAAAGKSVALFHNIRSLHKHFGHVLQDCTYTTCNFIMFCETWCREEDNIDIPHFTIMHRRDCIREGRHPFGTVLYVRDCLVGSVEVVFGHEVHTEFRGTALHAFADIVGFVVKTEASEIGIVFLHRSPKCKFKEFSRSVKKCVDLLQRRVPHITIVGDFNVNVRDNDGLPLRRLMDFYGLKLCVASDAVSTDSLTLIDASFSNVPGLTAHITESVISDHKPVWFAL